MQSSRRRRPSTRRRSGPHAHGQRHRSAHLCQRSSLSASGSPSSWRRSARSHQHLKHHMFLREMSMSLPKGRRRSAQPPRAGLHLLIWHPLGLCRQTLQGKQRPAPVYCPQFNTQRDIKPPTSGLRTVYPMPQVPNRSASKTSPKGPSSWIPNLQLQQK